MEKNYKFIWIGRCQYGNIDKVWGVFQYKDTPKIRRHEATYAFWGNVGKRLSISQHDREYYTDMLIDKKKKNGYNQISQKSLESIFNNLYDNLDESFVFHKLSE